MLKSQLLDYVLMCLTVAAPDRPCRRDPGGSPGGTVRSLPWYTEVVSGLCLDGYYAGQDRRGVPGEIPCYDVRYLVRYST